MKWSVSITRISSRWSLAHLRSTSDSRSSLSPISTLVGVVFQAASGRAPNVARVTRAPWMVTEVPADVSWESRSVAFVQPVLVIRHESSIGEEEHVRVGVDPAKIFGRKAGGLRYVADVDQPRYQRVPGCRNANDTAAIGPTHCSNRRGGGSYGIANFVSILDKSGRGVRWDGKSGVITCICASSNARRTQRQSSGFPHRP
jgi:hypothetical protein